MDIILNLKYAATRLGITVCNLRNINGERDLKIAQLNTDYAMCKLFKEMQANQGHFDANPVNGVIISNRIIKNLTDSIGAELEADGEIMSSNDLQTITFFVQVILKAFAEGNVKRYLSMGAFNGPNRTSVKDHNTLNAIRDLIYVEMPIRLAVESVANDVQCGDADAVFNTCGSQCNDILINSAKNPEQRFFPGETTARRIVSSIDVGLEKRMFNALLNRYETELETRIADAAVAGPFPESEEMVDLDNNIKLSEAHILDKQAANSKLGKSIAAATGAFQEECSVFLAKIKSLFFIGTPTATTLDGIETLLSGSLTKITGELTELTRRPSTGVLIVEEATQTAILELKAQKQQIESLQQTLSELKTKKQQLEDRRAEAARQLDFSQEEITQLTATLERLNVKYEEINQRNRAACKAEKAKSVALQKKLLKSLQTRGLLEEEAIEASVQSLSRANSTDSQELDVKAANQSLLHLT